MSVESEIIAQQKHGRQKYGGGENNLEHDDRHSVEDWLDMIQDHVHRARCGTPLESRQFLINIAGLAKSGAESFDRKTKRPKREVTL